MDQNKEFLKTIRDFNESMGRIQVHRIQSFAEAVRHTQNQMKAIFTQDRLNGFLEIGEKIRKATLELSKVNWDAVIENIESQYYKDIFAFAKKMSEEEIYVNFIYFDHIPFGNYEEYLDKEMLLSWMGENVDEVLSIVSNKDYMSRHKKLMVQSLRAYNAGEKEIAILGILPAIEFFISNWLVSQENDGVFDHENPTTKQWEKKKLKELSSKSDDEKEHELIDEFFEHQAMRGAHKIFVYDSKSNTPRNSLVHGSFDYSKLEDLDYVKLVYLFHSLLPLYQVVIEQK